MEAEMYDPLDPYDVRKNKTTYLELHFNPLNPLPTKDDESKHETYFELESSYMPRSGYSKNRDTFLFRNRAVVLISKYGQCDNLPFIAYLAMNYFDRYITRENLVLSYPRLIQHGVDIIAFACLTIAWKMKDLNFSITRFLAERPELAKIRPEQLVSTEISILNELNWKMRPVTPFSFVPYFCDKLKAKHGFRPRAICEIIVHAQDGIWIMELKPSVVAISAFLAASHYLYPGEINQFLCEPMFKKHFQEVQGDIDACTKHMIRLCHDLKFMIEGAVSESPSIPTFKVQTGQRYRGTDKGEQNPPASQYEKGKGKMWEIVEDREDQLDHGKNKVDMYRVPELPKMAEDSEEVQFSFQLRWRWKSDRINLLTYDPTYPIPQHETGDIETFFKAECSSMAGQHCVWNENRSPLRNLAVAIIFKYSQGRNFDPLTGFMAMSYFDHYAVSSDQLDEFTPGIMDSPTHDLELLVVCCLSLAWKMKRKPSTMPDFLGEQIELGIVSQHQFRRMELHILKTLHWNLRSVTAFSFLPFYHSVFGSTPHISCIEIIIQSQKDVWATTYKPSVLALSAFLAAFYCDDPQNFKQIIGILVSAKMDIEDTSLHERYNFNYPCVQNMIKLCRELALEGRIRAGELDFRLKWDITAGTNTRADNIIMFGPEIIL